MVIELFIMGAKHPSANASTHLSFLSCTAPTWNLNYDLFRLFFLFLALKVSWSSFLTPQTFILFTLLELGTWTLLILLTFDWLYLEFLGTPHSLHFIFFFFNEQKVTASQPSSQLMSTMPTSRCERKESPVISISYSNIKWPAHLLWNMRILKSIYLFFSLLLVFKYQVLIWKGYSNE